MYVTIGSTDYAKLKTLLFAPQVSLTVDALPVDEFQVDIITDDTISIGTTASLYDDLDDLWAKYRISYAERIDSETIRVVAQSRIGLLDRAKMHAVMYSGATAASIVGTIFASMAMNENYYSLDSTLGAKTITGWCPEQTARERLHWVLMMVGGYAKTIYTDKIELLPVDTTATLIPINKTYWKPSLTHRDYVTAVRVTAYSYVQQEPQTKETWVSDGTNTWVQTEQQFTLYNQDAPAAAADNVVEVDGLTLVNADNVSALMTFLSQYYFTRGEVTMEVINNGEYEPGQKVTFYLDAGSMAEGYIESCSFTFGLQAKSQLKLTAVEEKDVSGLTIRCFYGTMQIGKARYTFPVDYSFSIENPYITWEMNDRRYVFRPTTAYTSGTMTSTNQVVDVQYAVALECYQEDLRVVSVDSVSVSESGEETVVRTAVIG